MVVQVIITINIIIIIIVIQGSQAFEKLFRNFDKPEDHWKITEHHEIYRKFIKWSKISKKIISKFLHQLFMEI